MQFLKPSAEEIRRFGPLAYVTEAERARIMAMPSGQGKRAVALLEKEIEKAKKKGGK